MARRLYLQRRRLGLVFLLACLAGSLNGGSAMSLAAALIWPLAATGAAAALVASLPNYRNLVEYALAGVCLAPVLGDAVRAGAELPEAAGIVLAGSLGLAVLSLLQIPLMHVTLPLRVVYRGEGRVRLPPEEALRRYAGLSGQWNPMIDRLEPVRGERDLYRQVYRDGIAGQHVTRLIRIERAADGRSLTITDDPETGGRAVMRQRAVARIAADPDGDGARLTMVEAVTGFGLWTTPVAWLDDMISDSLEHFAALVEHRPDPSIKGAMVRSLAGRS